MSEATIAQGQIWERTTELRIVRAPIMYGQPITEHGRLQQAWYCRETGDVEWHDVPVIQPADAWADAALQRHERGNAKGD